MTPLEQRLALLMVCMGSFMSPFTMAAVNIAIPSIASDLQIDAASIAWLPTLFLLANVALLLPFSSLADNYGRKRVYLAGLLLSMVASVAGALAPNSEWLLASRALQGAASAMLFGTSLAIITSVFPAEKRGLPLGLNTASIYIGLTIAPAVGGWVTEHLGWRGVFFLPLPLAISLLILGSIFIKHDWKKDTFSAFDWVGSSLFAAWAVTFVLGFSLLPAFNGTLLLVLSVMIMGVFILHQTNRSSPLIRVQLFTRNRMFSFSVCTAFLMYASNYPLGFLLSLYLQYIRGLTPADAGQILLTQACAMALLAPFSGKLSDKVEPRTLTTLGCASTLLGFLLLSQLHDSTAIEMICASLFLIGIGFGLFSSPNHNAVMSAVESKDIGVASASLNLARVCGNIFSMSLASCLIHVFIGRELIRPENYPDLMRTVDVAFAMAIAMATIAILLSANRGKRLNSTR